MGERREIRMGMGRRGISWRGGGVGRWVMVVVVVARVVDGLRERVRSLNRLLLLPHSL